MFWLAVIFYLGGVVLSFTLVETERLISGRSYTLGAIITSTLLWPIIILPVMIYAWLTPNKKNY